MYPYFRLLGQYADRDRFDLRFASLAPSPSLQRDVDGLGLPAFSLDSPRRADYPAAAVRLARQLRREHMHVVHTHSLDASLVGLLAARASRSVVGVATAHYSHEIPLYDRWTLSKVDALSLGRFAHHVIAPSDDLRDTLIRFHGVAPSKVTAIDNGIELEYYEQAASDGSEVRDELGLGERLVMTSIGRVYWIKNQESLIRAFATVAPEQPEAVLVLAGDGDQKALRELAASLALEDRMRILPPRDDTRALLAATDLFVHPALGESFGVVIIEAMATGRPVMSTPVGIAREAVEDGVTGVLAAGHEPRDLAQAMRRALSVRDDWEAMGRAARRRVSRFSASRMVARYERLYEELVQRAGGRQP